MRDAEAMIFKTQSNTSIGMELSSETYSSNREVNITWLNGHPVSTIYSCHITRKQDYIKNLLWRTHNDTFNAMLT